MKKILKSLWNITQILLKSALAVFIVFASYTYLNKVFYNEDVYTAEDFKQLPENSMDVIILGSSHARFSFMPSFFYEDTGMYSFVMGSACQQMEISYQMLHEVLKTQSPKLVIMEVMTATPIKYTCLTDNCYITAEYMMTGEEKYNTINYLPEEKAASYYNDFINYHNQWRTEEDYRKILPSVALKEEDALADSNLGYAFNPTVWPTNFWGANVYKDCQKTPMSEKDERYLNEILKTCRENGIALYLYKTPVDGVTEEDYAVLQSVWEWAEENNIPYFDFLTYGTDVGLFLNLHLDSYHAFINGSGLITDILAEEISEMDIKFDHKDNPELDKLYYRHSEKYTADYLNNEVNPLIYLKRFANSTGVVAFIYKAKNSKPLDEVRPLLDQITDGRINYNEDYYCLLYRGEILQDGNTPFEYQLNGSAVQLEDSFVSFGNTIYHYDSPLALVYTNSDFSRGTLHQIEYRGYTWEWGWHYYTKD